MDLIHRIAYSIAKSSNHENMVVYGMYKCEYIQGICNIRIGCDNRINIRYNDIILLWLLYDGMWYRKLECMI